MSKFRCHEPLLDISRDFGSMRIVQLCPYEDAVGTTQKVFWSNPADPDWNASAVQIEIWSSSASDTGAGVGARTVLVSFIDDNMDEAQETVELNGTTIVTLASYGYRVNHLEVLTVGSSAKNVGGIYASHSAKAQTLNLINVNENVSKSGLLSMGNGQTLYLKNMVISNGGSPGCFLEVLVRTIGDTLVRRYCRFHITALLTQTIDLNWMSVGPGEEFYCVINTGSSITNMNGVINGVIEE